MNQYINNVMSVCVISLLFLSNANASLVINGDFETGDISGWTSFTTSNGTISGPFVGEFVPPVPYPIIEPFDTNGDSSASNAPRFSVGKIRVTGSYSGGGGIFQSVSTSSGLYDFNADIASFNGLTTSGNSSGGIFSILIDGIVIDTFNFWSISADSIERATLSGTVALGSGLHELRILIQRPFTNGGTPSQYIDNITLMPSIVVPVMPAAWLFCSGLIGLIGVARKKFND